MVDVAEPRRGLRADPADGPRPTSRSGFFAEARQRPPEEIVEVLVDHVAREGALVAEVWLVDVQQESLQPFPARSGGSTSAPMSLEGTLAGRCYQDGTVVVSGVEDPAEDASGDCRSTESWFPLRRGAERLGVARVRSAEPLRAETLDRLDDLFDAFVHVVTSTAVVSDALVRARRTEPMGLAAEIQWSMMPPLSWEDRRVTVSAVLEPAYDVAGDSVDYNVDGRQVSLGIFDGMGHGLGSARMSSLTVNAYRNRRRAGLVLPELATALEQVLRETLLVQEGFTTAVLAELDLDDGTVRWVNAGHLDPLLFRDTRYAGPLLARERQRPLALAMTAEEVDGQEPRELEMGHAMLQPGDAVLLFTDGVTEARDAEGEQYGVERLCDRVSAHLSSGLAAQEIMRRISRSVLEHCGGRLDDDATLLLVQWHGPDSGEPEVGEPVVGGEA
ncbi:serine/threonine-protein phosphatase [Nocardioidaceae bacterium]|nr:serine/threonine-protein phosphatase [Nocardioidaceae bacterium]